MSKLSKEYGVSLIEIIVTRESTGLVYLAAKPEDLMLVDEQEALVRANHNPHAITPAIEEDGETLRWDAEWTHDPKVILGEGLALPPTIPQAFDFQPLLRFSLGRYGKLDLVGLGVDREEISGELVSGLYSDKALMRVAQIARNGLRTDELTVGPSPYADNQLLWEATWGRGKPGANIITRFFQNNLDTRMRGARIN